MPLSPGDGSTGGRAALTDLLPRLRKYCKTLPGFTEVEAWGTPTFRARNKMFAMYVPAGHHGEAGASLWCKSTIENQQLLLQIEPKRYFFPPYVGKSGWVGIRITRGVVWRDVESAIEDGYRLVAGKKLTAELDRMRR